MSKALPAMTIGLRARLERRVRHRHVLGLQRGARAAPQRSVLDRPQRRCRAVSPASADRVRRHPGWRAGLSAATAEQTSAAPPGQPIRATAGKPAAVRRGDVAAARPARDWAVPAPANQLAADRLGGCAWPLSAAHLAADSVAHPAAARRRIGRLVWARWRHRGSGRRPRLKWRGGCDDCGGRCERLSRSGPRRRAGSFRTWSLRSSVFADRAVAEPRPVAADGWRRERADGCRLPHRAVDWLNSPPTPRIHVRKTPAAPFAHGRRFPPRCP